MISVFVKFLQDKAYIMKLWYWCVPNKILSSRGSSFVLTVIKIDFKCISYTDDLYIDLTYLIL
jgi:hypothetical protein